MAISPFIIEANKYEPKMRSALIKAFNELRTQESRAAIVRALQEGGVEAVMRMYENIEPKIAAQLSPVIDQALGAGASLPATMIPAGAFLNKDVTVSLYNQATVSYLERYKLDLIQQIGSNTREAVRTSLIADQIAGINPVETARNFRNTLGLTAKQEQSVRNYRTYLETLDKQALQRELRDKRHDSVISRAIADQKPLSPEQIEKMTNRYREKYIKYRAETIARTEALRAVSIGNRAALDQMIGNADVDTEKLRRFWHYTGDSRTRQAHRDIPGMNKEGRKLDEPFQTPLGPLMLPRDPSGSAENTIKCRCVEFYRLKLNDGKLKGPVTTDEKPKITIEDPPPQKDQVDSVKDLIKSEKSRLTKQYSGVKESLKGLPIKATKTAKLDKDGSLGLYTHGGIKIAGKAKDTALSSDLVRKPIQGKLPFVVDPTFEGIIRHEVGHAVYYNRVGFSEFPHTKPTWGKLFNTYKSKSVSTYASTNENEFFAESFSIFTHKKYDKNKDLPKLIHDFLEEVLK